MSSLLNPFLRKSFPFQNPSLKNPLFLHFLPKLFSFFPIHLPSDVISFLNPSLHKSLPSFSIIPKTLHIFLKSFTIILNWYFLRKLIFSFSAHPFIPSFRPIFLNHFPARAIPPPWRCWLDNHFSGDYKMHSWLIYSKNACAILERVNLKSGINSPGNRFWFLYILITTPVTQSDRFWHNWPWVKKCNCHLSFLFEEISLSKKSAG